MSYSLIEALKLVFSENSVPRPDRLRIYNPNFQSLMYVLQHLDDQVRSGHSLTNTNAFLPHMYWNVHIQAWARAYMLTTYHDYYKQLNVLPSGFTPQKVSGLVAGPFPTLLVNAIREFFRPMVGPTGVMLIPSPDFLANRIVPFTHNSCGMNGARIGRVDQDLLRFGIVSFPYFSRYIKKHYLGLDICLGIKRESLAPKKVCLAVKLIKSESSSKDKSLEKKDEDESSSSIELSDDSVEAVAQISKVMETAGPSWKHSLEVRYDYKQKVDYRRLTYHQVDLITEENILASKVDEPVYDYFLHDFDEKDYKTDICNRILTPLVVELNHDYRSPCDRFLFERALDFMRPLDHYEFHPVTSAEFVSVMTSRLGGNWKYLHISSLLARICGPFSDELREWTWPTAGHVVSDVIYTPSLSGSEPRPRRPRRRGKQRSQPLTASLSVEQDKSSEN